MKRPPELVCRRLALPDLESWEANAAALQDAQACPLDQTWRWMIQRRFLPARVRTGWIPGSLLVYAEMEDVDVFNPVTGFNRFAFKHGDVFEIFLRPREQAAYYEIHITPQNQVLQLRIPSDEHFHSEDKDWAVLRSWLVYERQIASQVRVDSAANRWWLQAAIPFDMILESGRVEPGSQWRFSFSRYDYTRGRRRPVLSSTSPHMRTDFHRQKEWGTLTFA